MVLHQHLVVQISLSVYGMLRQDNKKPNQMVIQMGLIQFVTLLMVLYQHLVVMIGLSVYGMQKHQRKYLNQIVIIKICLPSLTYLFRIAPYCQMVLIINYYLVNPDLTILRICQNPILEASGTLILQGQFINHQGKDLKPLFKSKGSCFLEDLKQKK
ncbi:unnamed protein product [Paramecium octaurelia]|uniref:Transmembrane protein n=1 Tax=Paramecium octaurelia TaxID=43137 RepID=A0A8S1X221_PAROT|nr:unnamed protein product [Paramecium octaurelia]